MSESTNQTVTLTADQLQAIIGNAVAEALGAKAAVEAPKPEPKPEPKPRKTKTGRKALFQHAATAAAAAPEPAKSSYGKAVSKGINAQAVAKAREQQLEDACPGITSLVEIAHVGKDNKGQHTKSFADMDRAGNLFWTWVTLPGKSKAEVEKACSALLGVEYPKVADALKACGYGYNAKARCWRTRCDGTPALGGRKFQSQHIERYAFASDD